MGTFYHVDRLETLNKGDVIRLDHELKINSTTEIIPAIEHRELIESLYPEGLTFHGTRYIYQSPFGPMPILDIETGNQGTVRPDDNTSNSIRIEQTFELARHAFFQDSTRSRFQSIFAFDDPNEALNLRKDSSNPVWIVEGESHQKHDMDGISSGHQFADTLNRTMDYWNGDPVSDNPTWEILLEPPVRVIERSD